MEVFCSLLTLIWAIVLVEYTIRTSKTNKKILEELKEIKYRMRG